MTTMPTQDQLVQVEFPANCECQLRAHNYDILPRPALSQSAASSVLLLAHDATGFSRHCTNKIETILGTIVRVGGSRG